MRPCKYMIIAHTDFAVLADQKWCKKSCSYLQFCKKVYKCLYEKKPQNHTKIQFYCIYMWKLSFLFWGKDVYSCAPQRIVLECTEWTVINNIFSFLKIISRWVGIYIHTHTNANKNDHDKKFGSVLFWKQPVMSCLRAIQLSVSATVEHPPEISFVFLPVLHSSSCLPNTVPR